MGWQSFYVVRFDLGPLLQGQMRIAQCESAYKSFIIGPPMYWLSDALGLVYPWHNINLYYRTQSTIRPILTAQVQPKLPSDLTFP